MRCGGVRVGVWCVWYRGVRCRKVGCEVQACGVWTGV